MTPDHLHKYVLKIEAALSISKCEFFVCESPSNRYLPEPPPGWSAYRSQTRRVFLPADIPVTRLAELEQAGQGRYLVLPLSEPNFSGGRLALPQLGDQLIYTNLVYGLREAVCRVTAVHPIVLVVLSGLPAGWERRTWWAEHYRAFRRPITFEQMGRMGSITGLIRAGRCYRAKGVKGDCPSGIEAVRVFQEIEQPPLPE